MPETARPLCSRRRGTFQFRRRRGWSALLTVAIRRHAGLAAVLACALGASRASELFRPHYHFTPERNWINDPNGLVFFRGEYHLFYQFNPLGNTWGHMSWGHAVSRDLLHWESLPLALAEADGVMIFSGSALVDWSNTSGFGSRGQPPLVAVYTGNRIADGRQAQCLAFSTDRGRSWTKFGGNPVLDQDSTDFRDPKVFWYKPARQWVMVVSMAQRRQVQFYSSANLKDWTRLGQFGPVGATNGVWECPDLFPLRVEGQGRRTAWVLVVNVASGSPAGGSGTQYFIGRFDGHTFTPDEWTGQTRPLWADYGSDCYAAVSWSDLPKHDGRRIWLGWMSNWQYAKDLPTSPWRNAMTLPRELALRDTGPGLQLVQQPARELRRLRGSHHSFKDGSLDQANQWLRKKHLGGDCFEMEVVLEPGNHGQCGLRLRKGPDQQTVVGFDEVAQRVFVDRSHSGNVSFNPAFAGIHHASARTPDGLLKLHLFMDACSLELFVNDGERVFSELLFPAPGAQGAEFFSRASTAMVRSATVWTLRPAFTGR